LIIRFQEARNYLLEKYEDQQFIAQDNAKKIVVLTWLLTDPDAEKSNLEVTELERWSWEPTDDITKMSRGAAQSLWVQSGAGYERWMKVSRIALSKLGVEEDYGVDSSRDYDKKRIFARKFAGNLLRATVRHIPFVGAFLYDVIYGTLDSMPSQEKIGRKSKLFGPAPIAEKRRAVAKDKEKVEKWYQNRTIQAALISAGVLLIVSIAGWLLNYYVSKQVPDLTHTKETSVEKKALLSLKEICQDIDSRPLVRLLQNE